MSLQAIHDFEVALLEPCLSMSHRGIKINDSLRLERIKDLGAEIELLTIAVQEAVKPLLKPGIPREKLFLAKWCCPCCRGGKAKSQECWSCAGFEKKPTKKQLTVNIAREGEEPVATVVPLAPCLVCEGVGKRQHYEFNLASNDQKKVLLYDLLKLPKRTTDGKLRSDEETLKELLAHDKTDVVSKLLKVAKATTMRTIYSRIEPAEDGRVHTFYNPAGTETGRFSSRGGRPDPKGNEPFALLHSTNLQNMPKREAGRDTRFNVRETFIPDEGMVFVEADLAGAEAWVTAACCGDQGLLEKLRTPDFNVHKWTGSYIFDYAAKEIDKDTPQYFISKESRHATSYGLGWQTHQRRVNAEADVTGVSITAVEAKHNLEVVHDLHPTIKGFWWPWVYDQLADKGWLETCFGRRRTFFGRRQGEKFLDSVHREAIAYEPQSTVADLLNHGMLNWWNRCEGKFGELLMQVHDSIVVQTKTELASMVARLLRQCLEIEIEVHGIKLVIPVDVQVGEANWAHLRSVA